MRTLISMMTVMTLATQLAGGTVRTTTGEVTINTSAMQSFSKTDMLPYIDTPFKGVVPVTFSSGKGPLKNGTAELYLELQEVFAGTDTYLFSSVSGSVHICRSDKKKYYPVGYAEIRFPGLENQTLGEFLFYVYSVSKYGIGYELYNDGEKLADNEGGSAVEYERPFVAKDLKIVISGFDAEDTERAFKIDNKFSYYYYDAMPPEFGNAHYIVSDGSSVSLSTSSSGSRIIYTTDGEIPSLSYGDEYAEGTVRLNDGYNVVSASTFMNGEVESDALEHAVISREFYVIPDRYLSDMDFTDPSGLIVMNHDGKELSEMYEGTDSFSLEGYELGIPGCNFTISFQNGAVYDGASVRLESGAVLTVRNYSEGNRLQALEFIGDNLVMDYATAGRSLAGGSFNKAQNLFISNGNDLPATFTVENGATLSSLRFGGSGVPTGIAVNLYDENIEKRYYNLQGIEVDSETRIPGVYIEVCNGKSRKVIIR